MANRLNRRLSDAWNAFWKKDDDYTYNPGTGYSHRPDIPRMARGSERTITSGVYTRIAIDVSSIPIRHVRLDQNGRFVEEIRSGLNDCLTTSANKDQSGRDFIRDVVISMFEEGCVAVVPVDTTVEPTSASFDVLSLRTGKITEWYPDDVRVQLYNDRTGLREDLLLPKDIVCVIENPLYPVMNEQGSIVKRLIEKLNLLDAIDTQSGSGKLDLIIQLPYTIRTELKRKQAEERLKEIEDQLVNSKHGIAYADAAEKIVQLNRPVENNLMNQIEYLTSMLYDQLGLTKTVFDGTADEKTTINYTNRTIEPILTAITDGFNRKFLTKTARTQGQSVVYIRNPFSLIPMMELATVADTFTRNAILSTNELRAIIGYRPSDQPVADELRNKNLNAPNSGEDATKPVKEDKDSEESTRKEIDNADRV